MDNHHPDGKRPFTEREFACLQTFPLGKLLHNAWSRQSELINIDYKFTGKRTDIVRQVGNAVPPLPAQTLCEEILRQLRKTDEGGI